MQFHLCLWPFMEHESGYDLINYMIYVCLTLTRGLKWLTMWAITPFVCPDYFFILCDICWLAKHCLVTIFFSIKFSLLYFIVRYLTDQRSFNSMNFFFNCVSTTYSNYDEGNWPVWQIKVKQNLKSIQIIMMWQHPRL